MPSYNVRNIRSGLKTSIAAASAAGDPQHELLASAAPQACTRRSRRTGRKPLSRPPLPRVHAGHAPVCRGRAAHDPQGRQAHLFGDDAHAARAPARRQPHVRILPPHPRSGQRGLALQARDVRDDARDGRAPLPRAHGRRRRRVPQVRTRDRGLAHVASRPRVPLSRLQAAHAAQGEDRRAGRPRRLQPRPAGRDRALAGAPSRARTAGLRQDRHPHRAHRRRAQGRREPLRHALPHVHEPSRARHEGAHRRALHGPVHGHPLRGQPPPLLLPPSL